MGLFAIKLAQYTDVHDVSALALFLIGFGQVHAPAAVILLLRGQRAPGAILSGRLSGEHRDEAPSARSIGSD